MPVIYFPFLSTITELSSVPTRYVRVERFYLVSSCQNWIDGLHVLIKKKNPSVHFMEKQADI